MPLNRTFKILPPIQHVPESTLLLMSHKFASPLISTFSSLACFYYEDWNKLILPFVFYSIMTVEVKQLGWWDVYQCKSEGGGSCFRDEMTVVMASTSLPSHLPESRYHWDTSVTSQQEQKADSSHESQPWHHRATKSMPTTTSGLIIKWGKYCFYSFSVVVTPKYF